jgi:hypothetical protein
MNIETWAGGKLTYEHGNIGGGNLIYEHGNMGRG